MGAEPSHSAGLPDDGSQMNLRMVYWWMPDANGTHPTGKFTLRVGSPDAPAKDIVLKNVSGVNLFGFRQGNYLITEMPLSVYDLHLFVEASGSWSDGRTMTDDMRETSMLDAARATVDEPLASEAARTAARLVLDAWRRHQTDPASPDADRAEDTGVFGMEVDA
ncbi:hypothetical protein [Bifidobacterium jacchi]|uniref:Uncharacterized protein n=1 Tax=Bifidobacterium jacchi TaxID=2490545 RepID=A0A5N5RDU5_9BIFI|nr:hypothetical protein [Bifidobacterium jacchi]KAB5604150.1 hypothetical protein EHS19_10075 [Bifidobacterium jacchi]